MKPLFVLIIAFVLSTIIAKLITKDWQLTFSGNVAMCLMLCFTAMGHFMFTQGMSMMIPSFIPLKKEIVFITGIAEVLLGIALLWPQYRHLAGIALITMFVLMLPANINAAIRHVDYQKATYDGSGLNYLWFRIPLQLLFICWVWYFTLWKQAGYCASTLKQ